MNVVSLFAGCGGSSLGYKWAGCNVRLALEFQKYAAEVYRLNHPHTPVMEKDIRKVSGRDVLDCAGLEEVDILDGSPPCSDFSVNGKRHDGWGKVKPYSTGKRQRVDDLFFEYSRLVEELEPMVFVAENVKGLTMGKAGELLGSNQIRMFNDRENTIVDVLADLGYKVKYRVINAMYYGVPQSRERLFIIGYREDLCTAPTFPDRGRTLISTKEAIGDLINDGTDQRETGRRPELMKKFFRPGCSNNDIKRICKQNNLEVYQQSYRRDKWEEPFYTIKQHHTRPYHPRADRLLSIAEAKRLQTFPDDFILPHSPSQNWERIGRAVPPLLMKAIAINILSDLKRSNHGTS